MPNRLLMGYLLIFILLTVATLTLFTPQNSHAQEGDAIIYLPIVSSSGNAENTDLTPTPTQPPIDSRAPTPAPCSSMTATPVATGHSTTGMSPSLAMPTPCASPAT